MTAGCRAPQRAYYYWPASGRRSARPATSDDVAEFGARAHSASTCGDYQCGRLHWLIPSESNPDRAPAGA